MTSPKRSPVHNTRLRSGKGWIFVTLVLFVAGMLWRFNRPEISQGPLTNGSHETSPVTECTLDELDRVEGRLVLRENQVPFTGLIWEYYEDRQVKSHTRVEEGRPHGGSAAYFPNGQVQIREFYRQGVSHGKRVEWHENGIKKSERMIVGGVNHGSFRQWYANGTLSSTVEMFEGKPHGTARAWFPSSCLKTEVEMDHGTLRSRKSWDDGERFDPGASNSSRG